MRARAFLALIASGFATLAVAQSVADPAGKGASDAQAPVAPQVYRSPFAGYRPFADASVGSWRGVNDEVARIGGWKTYAREAYEASQQAAPVEKPPQSSAPMPESRRDGVAKPR